MLCGDFNARIGHLSDCINGLDDVSNRKVLDDGKNPQGEEFVEFLREMNLCVLNGRFDVSNDNYTCIGTSSFEKPSSC